MRPRLTMNRARSGPVFDKASDFISAGVNYDENSFVEDRDHCISARRARQAIYVQEKYSLKSPSGIAFSDFKGYEDWAVVSLRTN